MTPLLPRCRRYCCCICLLLTPSAVSVAVVLLPLFLTYRHLFRLAAAANVDSWPLLCRFRFASAVVSVIPLPTLPPLLPCLLRRFCCLCLPLPPRQVRSAAAAVSAVLPRLSLTFLTSLTSLPFHRCCHSKFFPPRFLSSCCHHRR